jgi:hypothetical protein
VGRRSKWLEAFASSRVVVEDTRSTVEVLVAKSMSFEAIAAVDWLIMGTAEVAVGCVVRAERVDYSTRAAVSVKVVARRVSGAERVEESERIADGGVM